MQTAGRRGSHRGGHLYIQANEIHNAITYYRRSHTIAEDERIPGRKGFHVPNRYKRLCSSCALGTSGKAVCDSALAGGCRRPGHGGAGLHAGPRRAPGVDLQPAHGDPQEQGAPGRNLLPDDPQRAEPARLLENGDRRREGIPRRIRRARPSRRHARHPPQGRRLVQCGNAARDAPRSRQGAERQRLPAGRTGRLLPPVLLHRGQSTSGESTQAAGRRWRRQRL